LEAFALRGGKEAGVAGAGLHQIGDEALVRLLRDGHEGAFEEIVERYRPRLFGFCRRMLGSNEDAEDVLQEVLANAYRAMLADQREINLKPWLFRITRNRCLNHLQRIRPVPEAQERLERIPTPDAAATHERVQNREEFRALLGDRGDDGQRAGGPLAADAGQDDSRGDQ
jgi:DNA-directed RNA polymerase specialized sigma24 family protein